jgi:hypothetical protein
LKVINDDFFAQGSLSKKKNLIFEEFAIGRKAEINKD